MRITMNLAGVPVGVELLYDNYVRRYGPYLTDKAPKLTIRLPDDELQMAASRYPECSDLPYVEHMELHRHISDLLLPQKRAFFHCTAFLWHGKAWLLTAPSGTGKSTQYILWKLLYGDEIRIINGDKPILQLTDSGEFVLHSSPWNGKENMGTQMQAPVGGIIYLKQSGENRMERVRSGMALPIFSQFLFSHVDEDSIRRVASMADRLLRTVPVWLLENCGDRASARLCHDTLEEALR